MTTAVMAEGLGKRYRILHQQASYGRFTESVSGLIRAPIDRLRGRSKEQAEWFWALRDVDLDIKVGDVVGIIGHNGAGKSTLLKVLSRVTEPTEGTAELTGRVASLLEIGTGFHPELTGRENIYLSGSVLGMRREETDRRFDEIVDFAGVEQFLDTPVKRFSSGMQVRLGFAVAAHLEPEILIVDEVLAVGDAAFQRKCVARMGDVAAEGRTVLVVSHNMAVVEGLCNRGILLQRGKVVSAGPANEVVRDYEGGLGAATDGEVDLTEHEQRLVGMSPLLKRARLVNEDGRVVSVFAQGEPIIIEIEYNATGTQMVLTGAGFALSSATGVRVGGFNTYMGSQPPHHIPQSGVVRFILKDPTLVPGAFTVSPSVGTHPTTMADKVDHALRFTVEPRDIYGTGYVLSTPDGVAALGCDIAVGGQE